VKYRSSYEEQEANRREALGGGRIRDLDPLRSPKVCTYSHDPLDLLWNSLGYSRAKGKKGRPPCSKWQRLGIAPTHPTVRPHTHTKGVCVFEKLTLPMKQDFYSSFHPLIHLSIHPSIHPSSRELGDTPRDKASTLRKAGGNNQLMTQ